MLQPMPVLKRILSTICPSTSHARYLVSLLLFSAAPSAAFAADYDRDGRDDLESVRVTRSRSGSGGRTSWAVRRSSDGRSLRYSFSVPGDAIFSTRRPDGRFYPGVVWVKSSREPLRWFVKGARGESRFSFGRPGDIVPNQQDVDGDGIGDFTVARPLADGSLQWFFKLSRRGSASTIFGRVEDKIFIAGDGMLIRVTPEYVWQGRAYNQQALGLNVQWGQPGDIAIAPRKWAQVAVARQIGSSMIIFIWNPDHTIQMVTVPTGFPSLGYYFNSREIDAAAMRGSARAVAFSTLDGSRRRNVRFGDSASAYLLPTNQVFRPGDPGDYSSTGGSGGSAGSGSGADGNQSGSNDESGSNASTSLRAMCPTIRSIQRGEIWKSIASTHIPSSDPRRFSTSFITLRSTRAASLSCLPLLDARGNTVHKLGKYSPSGARYSSRSYGGHGCGDQKSPSQVVREAISSGGRRDTYLKIDSKTCIHIPNANTCYNSSQCP